MNFYCECGRLMIAHCCWKLRREGEKIITCDKPICAKHAKEVAPGKFLCPEHETQYDKWRAKHPNSDLKRGEQQNLFAEAAA